MLCQNIESYFKECNIYLALKVIKYKFYSNLQLLLILTNWSKDLSIYFLIGLFISTN